MVILKIEYRFVRRQVAYAASQTTVLHMKRLSQTESPIFVILCVLVSKGNPFWLLFYMIATSHLILKQLKITNMRSVRVGSFTPADLK